MERRLLDSRRLNKRAGPMMSTEDSLWDGWCEQKGKRARDHRRGHLYLEQRKERLKNTCPQGSRCPVLGCTASLHIGRHLGPVRVMQNSVSRYFYQLLRPYCSYWYQTNHFKSVLGYSICPVLGAGYRQVPSRYPVGGRSANKESCREVSVIDARLGYLESQLWLYLCELGHYLT